jgi:hypothetical protein
MPADPQETVDQVVAEEQAIADAKATHAGDDTVAAGQAADQTSETPSGGEGDEPQFSDAQRARADELGLDLGLYSPDQLDDQLVAFDRNLLTRARGQIQQPADQQQAPPGGQLPPQGEAQTNLPEYTRYVGDGQPQQPPPTEPQQYFDFSKLTDLEVDEALARQLNAGLHGALQAPLQEIAQLRSQLKQWEEYQQQQIQQEANKQLAQDATEIDAAISTLDRNEVFGAGSYPALPENSIYRANRNQLAGEVLQMRDVMAQSGMRVPPLGELVARVAHVSYGSKPSPNGDANQPAVEPAQVKQQSRKRTGAHRRKPPTDQPFEGDLEDDPVLKRRWREMVAENG